MNSAKKRSDFVMVPMESEIHKDDLAVDCFAAAMKEKMKKSREKKGRSGWETANERELTRMLLEHVAKGDPVDVANFCMMLHQNGMRIVSEAKAQKEVR